MASFGSTVSVRLRRIVPAALVAAAAALSTLAIGDLATANASPAADKWNACAATAKTTEDFKKCCTDAGGAWTETTQVVNGVQTTTRGCNLSPKPAAQAGTTPDRSPDTGDTGKPTPDIVGPAGPADKAPETGKPSAPSPNVVDTQAALTSAP